MTLGVGVGARFRRQYPYTPARIGAMPGVTSWAHWPLHPALNRSLATVVPTLTEKPSWNANSQVTVGGTSAPYSIRATTTDARHRARQTPVTDMTPGMVRARYRVAPAGDQRWFSSTLGSVRGWFDLQTGAVGSVTGGTPTLHSIAAVGDGRFDCTLAGLAASADVSVELHAADGSTATYPGNVADGIDIQLIPGDTCYIHATHLQSIGDEGPRAAHLVHATPANQPDYNAWDVSGSQGGIAGARHPSGSARYMDAVDAVLGTALNSATHYAVTWSINSWTPGSAVAKMLSFVDSGLTSIDEPLASAGPSSRSRNRTGSAAAVYSGTGAATARSRVVVLDGAASSYYENGTLIGSATVVSPLDITADRVRVLGSQTGWEGLFLGGGMFVFDSADSLNAALPAIHAMVAFMRALWGIT